LPAARPQAGRRAGRGPRRVLQAGRPPPSGRPRRRRQPRLPAQAHRGLLPGRRGVSRPHHAVGSGRLRRRPGRRRAPGPGGCQGPAEPGGADHRRRRPPVLPARDPGLRGRGSPERGAEPEARPEPRGLPGHPGGPRAQRGRRGRLVSRPGHTLKVRCPTWEHVESFYARKVKDDNTLSARVPWSARPGDVVTLALELPDELVLTIDAVVGEVMPAPDDRKSAVRMTLTGLTPALRARLIERVARELRPAPPPRPPSTTRPPPSNEPVLPVAQPADAPVDEVVEALTIPDLSEVPAAQRPIAEHLIATLARMRAAAASDVLGVDRAATVAE